MKVFKRFNSLLYLCLLALYIASFYVIFQTNSSSSPAAAAETLVIQPGSEGKDSYIFGGSNQNFGSSDTLSAGGGTGSPPPLQTLVQFDLSQLPAGANINSASFSLYYYNTSGAVPNQSLDLSLHKITSSWAEDTVNFTIHPSIEATPITTITIGDSSAYGWYTIDVSNVVRSWYSGSTQNYGLLLNYTSPAQSTGKSFYSSDHDTLRPKLSITYTTAAPEPAPSHKSCVSGSCVSVDGEGTDSCSDNTQCTAPLDASDDNTHTVCNANDACVSVPGEGADQCKDTQSCNADPVVEIGVGAPVEQSLGQSGTEETPSIEETKEQSPVAQKIIKPFVPITPLVPLAAAGVLSLASVGFTLWSFVSAQLSAKEFLLATFNYLSTMFKAKAKDKLGVVYDASTHKPIAGALVNLYLFPETKLIASAITDLKGRFYFVADKGQYALSSSFRGFVFPSILAKNERSYMHDLYLGQTINVNDALVVNYKIPMDPSSSIESKPTNPVLAVIFSDITRLLIMVAGTAFSVYMLYAEPIKMNYIIVCSYLLLWVIEYLIERRTVKFSKIVEAANGKPIDLALVRVVSATGKLVQSYISDHRGRVMIKISSSGDTITIERHGYKKVSVDSLSPGFIEGEKFRLEKL